MRNTIIFKMEWMEEVTKNTSSCLARVKWASPADLKCRIAAHLSGFL